MATRSRRTLSDAASKPRDRARRSPLTGARRRFGVAVVLAALAGALIGDAWHLSQPGTPAALRLPAFHGQGHWRVGERRAPVFTLRDQSGASVSLAAQRGEPVVIAFLDAAKGAGSDAEAASLAEAQALLARSRRPVLDVIGLGPGAHASTRAAAARWGLKPPYRWLTGPAAEIARIRAQYGVRESAPAGAAAPIYLVDRAGFERAGYLYPFFPTVLAGDLQTLSRRS